jgi:hypothetical protein
MPCTSSVEVGFLVRRLLALGMLSTLATSSVSAAEPPRREDRDEAETTSAPVPPHAASSGIMLGASVDYLAPILGNLGGSGGAGPGTGLGVHVGYRWRILYVGAAYEHGFLTGTGEGGHDGTPWNVTAAWTDYVGVDIDTISDPDAVLSFVTHFSAGYRTVSTTETCCYSSTPTTGANSGPEMLLVGIGLQINVGGRLRLQPEASLAYGPETFGSLGLTAFFDLGRP